MKKNSKLGCTHIVIMLDNIKVIKRAHVKDKKSVSSQTYMLMPIIVKADIWCKFKLCGIFRAHFWALLTEGLGIGIFLKFI